MLILLSSIHLIFLAIFYLFHRPIEMMVIGIVWIITISKIIPPIDIFKRPKFFKEKLQDTALFEQSLYLGSGLLFYTALIGVALGIANVVGSPADIHLLQYCLFFLTSIIYGIYLLMYPRDPNVFTIFRVHTIIASVIINVLILTDIFFGKPLVDIFTLINSTLLALGSIAVLILDRSISRNIHDFCAYLCLVTCVCFLLGILSFFPLERTSIIFILLIFLWAIYIFFRYLLHFIFKKEHLVSVSWHFFNTVLLATWCIFGYSFWSLFWSPDIVMSFLTLTLLLIGWIWIYQMDDKNAVFFTGMTLIFSTFMGYVIFRASPPLFSLIAIGLFVYSGGLLLCSRMYKDRVQEQVLAGSAVFFLCVCDIVLIFQHYSLFSLSTLFLFQSLIWYGAYEIFHRHAQFESVESPHHG